LLAASTLMSWSQTTSHGTITLLVQNDQQNPLENVTVQLLKAKDSSLVKVAITDKNGSASFENIAYGSYLAKISMVNFSTKLTNVFTLSASDFKLENIRLEKSDKQMQEVVVKAERPVVDVNQTSQVANISVDWERSACTNTAMAHRPTATPTRSGK